MTAPTTTRPVDAPESIPAETAVARVRERGPSCVLDVRTGAEYRGEHVPGSRHVPLDQLSSRIDEITSTPGELVLMCQSGQRAARARSLLKEAGIERCVVVEGGMRAYAAGGGETVRNASVMSLERQVRIAAGSIVLVAVVLGFTVHPAVHALAGFVGAGLVFAGVSDTCGMGMLLARMPWNRA